MLNDKWNGHIIAGNLGSNFYGWRWEEVVGKCFKDIDNQHFVLLSDRYYGLPSSLLFHNLFFQISTLVCVYSCVPLHNFDYVYDYLMGANLSFIDW